MRLYHVVTVVENARMHNFGNKTYFTVSPLTHEQACTLMSKITSYSWRRKFLEEVVS